MEQEKFLILSMFVAGLGDQRFSLFDPIALPSFDPLDQSSASTYLIFKPSDDFCILAKIEPIPSHRTSGWRYASYEHDSNKCIGLYICLAGLLKNNVVHLIDLEHPLNALTWGLDRSLTTEFPILEDQSEYIVKWFELHATCIKVLLEDLACFRIDKYDGAIKKAFERIYNHMLKYHLDFINNHPDSDFILQYKCFKDEDYGLYIDTTLYLLDNGMYTVWDVSIARGLNSVKLEPSRHDLSCLPSQNARQVVYQLLKGRNPSV